MNVYYIAERFVTCSADRCNRAATSNGMCADCCSDLSIDRPRASKPRRAA